MVHVNMIDPDSDDMDMDERAPSNRSASPANGPSSSGKAATLKRGDACLACRRRRIRCSAEKPACATCVRLKKQCVYETGKSTSRIAVLKARIADLESQLKERTPAPGPSITVTETGRSGPSGVGSSSSPAAAPPAPTPVSPGRGQTINPSALSFSIPTVQGAILPLGPASAELDAPPTPSNSNNSQSGPSSASHPTPAPSVAAFTPAPQSHSQGHGHSHHHAHAHNHGHQPTSTVRNPHYAQSTNPRPFGEPDPGFNMDLSFLDQPVSDLSASMFVATVTSQVDPSHVDMGFATSSHTEDRMSHKSHRNLHSTAKVGHEFSRLVGMRLEGIPYDSDTADEAMDVLASGEILPSVPLGRELVGGWFDPTDVPPGVRDHLLDLFFSRTNSKSLFGITFHLPRFYTRLTLPASKRPHPALLYSMYATAARVSTQPTIKQLENQFFEIADRQIRQAVAQHDRLLDALRGMALLTNYLFAKEKYSLGYHMTGAAVRLAISCGLDRIPSSVWTPPPPFNAAIHCTLRTGGYSIPPPEDPIDLAERIYAFWAVYEIDLCTAVAYLWHTGLPIEDIRTPFPRPMIDYELGLVSHKDDVSINSILNPTLAAGHIDNSFFVLRMKAITLLARVLKLRQERPEVDLGAEGPTTPLAGPHVCSYPGSAQPAFVTHPTGFAKIKQALDHLVDQLPEEHRPPWRWDEGETMTLPRRALSRDTSVLHFLIGNAYMQLWNVRALDADNAVALLVARRLVNVMYLFQTEPMSTGYDIFMITIWNEVAMVLVRETKRLAHVGEAQRAAEIDADLGVAIASMKKWGDVDISNEHDGADIAAINGKMLDQLRAMSKADWAEAMAESQRRFGAGELGVMPCNVPGGGGGAGHI